jgi:hypothetical protein
MKEDRNWAQIPTFGTRYLINKSGDIVVSSTGNYIKHSIGRAGVARVTIVDMNKKSRQISVAKAVLDSFSRNPTNSHKIHYHDGDRTNMHLHNLDWLHRVNVVDSRPVGKLTLEELAETRRLIGL